MKHAAIILFVCVTATTAFWDAFSDDSGTGANRGESFLERLRAKRGCAKTGSDCTRTSCCIGNYCNTFTGRCTSCGLKGADCSGYGLRCCKGLSCQYDGKSSFCG